MAALLPVVTLNMGCKSDGLKRPYGFLKLGAISDLQDAETYRSDLRLVVRRDERGFYVMSTECTYDLSPLTRSGSDSTAVWNSSYSASSYTADGKVLTGPAKVNLPFYNIKIDSAVYGGPRDTLYAEIGAERDPSWRFPPP